ncbi:hypothetical protein ABS71_01580 [bacterium SCN 62-11]|nr:MAG: hypothetical protein ABS71_01580 [bacterium SCN 62-11]
MTEEDPKLLEALAQELRQPIPLDLERFASQTAENILRQPRRPVDLARPWLEGPLHPAACLLLAAWGALCIWWSPAEAASWGMLLILVASLTKALLHLEDLRRPRLHDLFYLLPIWATLSTAAIAAALTVVPLAIGVMEFGPTPNLTRLPLAVLVGLFVYLSAAGTPVWRALRQRDQGHFRRLLQIQGGLALWIVLSQGILLYPLMLTYPWLGWLLPLLFSIAVSALLRQPEQELTQEPLRPALRQAGFSLLVPTATAAVLGPLAFWILLPTHMQQQTLYAQIAGNSRTPDLRAWREFENRFVDDSPRGFQDPVQDFYVMNQTARQDQAVAEVREFEKSLPQLKAALQNPDLHAPNTFQQSELYGLGLRRLQVRLFGLGQEHIRQRQAELALADLRLLLRCNQVFRGPAYTPSLFGRSDLCLRTLDSLLQLGLNRLQLEQLALELPHFQPDRAELEASIREGLRQTDQVFKDLRDGTPPPGPASKLWLLLPRRYWESERVRAFDSYSRALLDARLLDKNDGYYGVGELFGLPRPRSQAQTGFQSELLRFDLMKTLVALERYRSEHNQYPDHLQQLVPALLPQLPVDALDPALWSKKPALPYERRGDSYQFLVRTPRGKQKIMSSARGYELWD